MFVTGSVVVSVELEDGVMTTRLSLGVFGKEWICKCRAGVGVVSPSFDRGARVERKRR